MYLEGSIAQLLAANLEYATVRQLNDSEQILDATEGHNGAVATEFHFDMNGITVTLKTGSITDEEVDVIVCPSTQDLRISPRYGIKEASSNDHANLVRHHLLNNGKLGVSCFLVLSVIGYGIWLFAGFTSRQHSL